MNKSRFDTIVANRAHERVTAKIEAFRKSIADAFRNLHPSFAADYYNGFDYKARNSESVKLLLSNVAQGLYFQRDEKGEYLKEGEAKTTVRLKWPRILWNEEQEAVQKELLAVMDEMQRSLVAPPPSNDPNSPPPPEEIAP